MPESTVTLSDIGRALVAEQHGVVLRIEAIKRTIGNYRAYRLPAFLFGD